MAAGLRLEGLGQQRRSVFQAELTGTGADQGGRNRCQAPVGRPLPGGNQSPADDIAVGASGRVADDDVEHERCRQVTAAGYHGGPGVEGGSNPA